MTITAEQYAEKFVTVREAKVAPRESKICNACGAVLRQPAPLCGMCDADTLEAIISDLTAAAPASALAVWELRDRGLTARQVLAVRREVRARRPTYEIVKAIEGLSNWGAGE
jgi:hypothetical protein